MTTEKIVDIHHENGKIVLYRQAKAMKMTLIPICEITNPEQVLLMLANKLGYSITKLPPDTRTPDERILDSLY